MPYGVQYPDVVDLIAYRPATNEVALIMIEERPWNDSQQRLLEIQNKVHNYVGYAKDGQFEKAYNEYSGKLVCIELHCMENPPEPVMRFLDELNGRLSPYGIEMRVVVVKLISKPNPIPIYPWPKHIISWLSNLFSRAERN